MGEVQLIRLSDTLAVAIRHEASHLQQLLRCWTRCGDVSLKQPGPGVDAAAGFVLLVKKLYRWTNVKGI